MHHGVTAAKAEMLMGRFEAAEELYRQGMARDTSLQQDLIACQIGAGLLGCM